MKAAKPGMKEWSCGNGNRLTVSLQRSELNWPGNLRQAVTPDIVAYTRLLKSPYAGIVCVRIWKEIS